MSVSAETSCDPLALDAIGPLSRARGLRIEQPPSHHEQVGERRGHLESVQILGQAPLAHLAEAKDVLDHSEHVLNP